MKLRESGMPAQDYWETLFDVSGILDAFGLGAQTGNVVELGCGYGTFTIPTAQRVKGQVSAVDIDPEMVAVTRRRAAEAGISNVRAERRDVVASGFGVVDASCDAALLFNILHGENPHDLIAAAKKTLRPDGLIAVIHWRTDIATPRGPSAAIRPAPEQIVTWAKESGLLMAATMRLPPWHYGVALRMPTI
jgi:SAM-dependent methyltransferase